MDWNADKFLSTLPARGATEPAALVQRRQRNFYPRSPRGERPYTKGDVTYTEGDFYPRSPRGERRMERSDADPASAFLSMLPARGATLETRYITDKDKFL